MNHENPPMFLHVQVLGVSFGSTGIRLNFLGGRFIDYCRGSWLDWNRRRVLTTQGIPFIQTS